MNNKYLSKKTISPVVAVALLLVVAVVAVVGFQTWFSTYSSKIFSDADIKSNIINGNTGIDLIKGDLVYFLNANTENISITNVKVNGVSCNISKNASIGITELNIVNCSRNLTTLTPEVVVYTSDKIYAEKYYVDNSVSSAASQPAALNCSALINSNWITVTGNPTLGTSDFCVMKYEAKDVGGVATSQSALTPWVNINQTDARLKCQALGSGYDLITDPQWMTIARLIENDSTNWANGIIGSLVTSSGGLYRGNNLLVDSVGCDPFAILDGNTAGTNCLAGSRNKRTHNVSGELIWDLSGNVWEWTFDTLPTSGVLNSSLGKGTGEALAEWNTISSSYNYLKAFNTSLTSANGIGQVYYDGNTASPSGNTHGFRRGGAWYDGADAGVFLLSLDDAPSYADAHIGFRCSYNP